MRADTRIYLLILTNKQKLPRFYLLFWPISPIFQKLRLEAGWSIQVYNWVKKNPLPCFGRGFFLRCLADSNRRKRFCRPAPSHSDKAPFVLLRCKGNVNYRNVQRFYLLFYDNLQCFLFFYRTLYLVQVDNPHNYNSIRCFCDVFDWWFALQPIVWQPQ